MNKLTATGFLAAALLTTTAAQAEDFTYSSHLPPSVAVNDAGIIPMFERVNEETGGGLNVKYFWAGQLFDATGNFIAVRDGVADAAFTQPANNQAEMRTNAIFSDLYQFGGDPYATAGAINETLLLDCADCQAEYAGNNAVFLGTHAATPAKLICASEITSMDDIRGKKIIGGPALARWAQTLGATQFDVPPPRQMETIQRGQADCTFASPEWMRAFSLADVAKSVVDVPIGSQFAISIMTFNKDRWDGLSPELRTAFLKNMPIAIADIVDRYVEIEAEVLTEQTAKGLMVTDLGGEYQAAFDTYMAGYKDQVIGDATTRGIQNPEAIVDAFLENKAKWEQLIADNGSENFGELLWQEVYSKLPN
ncbi:C4-dicarboxylate TRAP transporter substrate-binding protein [Corticibacterium sp. UT-5YL-CI-8]|nr:C4-dicarboxylate TRAP transporter substrate-binding protein [Tianweitania sp. UT-5YL-CI-8]